MRPSPDSCNKVCLRENQVTGSSCVAAAAYVPGTLVNTISGKKGDKGKIRIGHPSGIMEVDIAVKRTNTGWGVTEASLIQTARRLAEGKIFATADRLPWRKESGGKSYMRAIQPEDRKRLRNEMFYAG